LMKKLAAALLLSALTLALALPGQAQIGSSRHRGVCGGAALRLYLPHAKLGKIHCVLIQHFYDIRRKTDD